MNRFSFPFLSLLFVAGCGQHPGPDAYEHVPIIKSTNEAGEKDQFDLNTYEGVVADIVAKLDDPSKTELRKIKKEDLIQLYLTWGKDIRNTYKLWSNDTLTRSCAKKCGKEGDMDPEDASLFIMEGVWSTLQKPVKEK